MGQFEKQVISAAVWLPSWPPTQGRVLKEVPEKMPNPPFWGLGLLMIPDLVTNRLSPNPSNKEAMYENGRKSHKGRRKRI